MPRARRRLEAARAPTTIKEQVSHRRLADNRTRIGAGIDNTSPLPVHTDAAKNGKQLDNRLQRMLNGWE